MKKKIPSIILLIGLIFIFSCTDGAIPPVDTENASVQGKAYFNNIDDSSGIVIRIERNDVSETQVRMTTTDENGTYSFTGCEPGSYTIYASSNNSTEKTVTAKVVIESGKTVTVDDLCLTAVGSIKGKIILDETDGENLGFIVFIAGTSCLSITDSDGSFTISDIPAGNKIKVLVMKDDFVKLWKDTEIKAFETSDLGTFNITSSELKETEIQKSKPSVPVFSISSGAVDYKDKIELTCDTVGAKIYYSLDDGITYHKYITPFEILDDIKITAYSSYLLDSDEVTAEYTVKYYNLSYSTGGIGNFKTVKNLRKGDKVTLYSDTVRGYNYKWYKDSNFTEEADSVITINGNVVIYGEFIPQVYKITYDLNAAYWKLPADYPQYHTYGTETVLPVPIALNDLASLFDVYGWENSSSGGYYTKIGPEDITSDVSFYYYYKTHQDPVCGNGKIEDGEECDDAIDPHCHNCKYLPVCGNGIIEAGEGCDDPYNPYCYNCLLTTCGNGVLESYEECDDPNDPYCSSLCRFFRCGDRIVSPELGEECDDPYDP